MLFGDRIPKKAKVQEERPVIRTPVKTQAKHVANKRVEHAPVGKKSTGKSTISQMKTCDATDD